MAKTDLWYASIKKALNVEIPPAVVTVVDAPGSVPIATLLGFAEDSEFVEATLNAFVKQYFMGQGEWSFRTQFFRRANKRNEHGPEYFPKMKVRYKSSRNVKSFGDSAQFDKYVNQTDDSALRKEANNNRRQSHMYKGFMALWDVFRIPHIQQAGSRYTLGLGRLSDLNALRLSDYMWLSGSRSTNSPVNSLFKAVEFGTGIAKNVGGPQYVRREGPTKEPDGSWWIGEERGEGVRVKGQKGFHFLYDEKTRAPIRGYTDFFRREFPRFFASRVALALSGGL